MISQRRSKGLTRGELIVTVVVLGILIAVTIPFITQTREASRRGSCLARLKQLALPFHEMTGEFPPSCRVKTSRESGLIESMDGFSWCVDMLPHLERQNLFETLDFPHGAPLAAVDSPGHSATAALATSIPEFLCPAFNGQPWIGPDGQREAITNYKPMGASHVESLNVASIGPLSDNGLYGDPQDHPDGGIHPGSQLSLRSFAKDGAAHTILLVETTEQYRARWTVGREACLVGLPASEVGMIFEKEFGYWHPTKFIPNRWGEDSALDDATNKTYLDWDYTASPYDDGGVAAGGAGISRYTDPEAPFYGPSSHHKNGVCHAYADGSAHPINRDHDTAAYFFLITRGNEDPFPPPEVWPD